MIAVKSRDLLLILPPILATAGVILWISGRKAELGSILEQTAELNRRVAAATSEAEASAGEFRKGGENNGGPAGVDWAAIAGKIQQTQRPGGTNLREMFRLQQMMLDWTAEDFEQAIADIDAAELNDHQRQRSLLLVAVADAYFDRDPSRALHHLGPMLKKYPILGPGLGNALKTLAGHDPTAAAAYLDKLIDSSALEAKSLDGQSFARPFLEACVLEQLFNSDVAAATRRLQAIPEQDRSRTFEHIPNLYEKPAAFAAVRSALEPEERSRIFATAVSEATASGGLERASRLFDEAGFTQEERTATIPAAGTASLRHGDRQGPVIREKVDQVREWIAIQDPVNQDSATGKMLAQLAVQDGKTSFSHVAAIASHYHDQGAGDDMITSLLSSSRRLSSVEERGALVERIRNPRLREEFTRLYK
jgi:hypothetical protein